MVAMQVYLSCDRTITTPCDKLPLKIFIVLYKLIQQYSFSDTS